MALYDTPKKVRSATNEDGVLTGYVEVDFGDIVDMNRFELEGAARRLLVGSENLDNIKLAPVSVDAEQELVTLHVQGKPDLDSLPADEPEPEPTPAVESKKD